MPYLKITCIAVCITMALVLLNLLFNVVTLTPKHKIEQRTCIRRVANVCKVSMLEYAVRDGYGDLWLIEFYGLSGFRPSRVTNISHLMDF
jgi:hypothetical protein